MRDGAAALAMSGGVVVPRCRVVRGARDVLWCGGAAMRDGAKALAMFSGVAAPRCRMR